MDTEGDSHKIVCVLSEKLFSLCFFYEFPICFCRDEENSNDEDVKKYFRKVYNHCDDILQNMIAIKAVMLHQNFHYITMKRLGNKSSFNKPPRPTLSHLNSFMMKKPQWND